MACRILIGMLILGTSGRPPGRAGSPAHSGRNASISARDLMRGHRRPQRRSERIRASLASCRS